MKALSFNDWLKRCAGRRLTAWVMYSSCALLWLVFALESPSWQRWLTQHGPSFAHLYQRAPRAGDPLRYVLQALAILILKPAAPNPVLQRSVTGTKQLVKGGQSLWEHAIGACLSIFSRLRTTPRTALAERWQGLGKRWRYGFNVLVALVVVQTLVLCITEPFDYLNQLYFVLLLWLMAMVLRRLPGRFATLMLMVLSVIVSCRYLWWRYSSTLNWADGLDLTLGLLLLLAETYAWFVLILGFIQTSWPLARKPTPLPKDTDVWPSVDLYIPTYNEDLAVVRNTVYAAKGLDWPADKLNIYILDDGKRAAFAEFAQKVGVGYITRPDNRHAKAGNLNHALGKTQGELIAIFDCDHVPVRSFLQVTCGGFLVDPKLALVQTPHHFLSPDPFERNLKLFRKRPNEGELFYGLVQEGNDLWNAAFFCGSCAVLRRSAIESIGGFAVQTVTEDAHTALRLHRNGWNSAYLKIVQAAGLATESLSAHVGQRIRWARGMAQIFRTDNPLFGKGLTLFQRLCYLNAMVHFLAGVPRLVFLLAPLAYLYFQAHVIYAPAMMIVLYVLPHMLHSSITNSRTQGQYRQTFWGEVYETVLAWYIARPTTVALFNPRKGAFNVTAKGGLIDNNHFDWLIAKPYVWLGLLNIAGLGFAVWRLNYGPAEQVGTVLVSSLWVIYNLLIIGAAMAVAAEVKQVRSTHRVQVKWPAALRLPTGHSYACQLHDYSDGGAGIYVPSLLSEQFGQSVQLTLWRGTREYVFEARVVRQHEHQLGLQFQNLNEQQKIDFVQCTLARADAWLNWQQDFETDRPLLSFARVLRLGVRGYQQMLKSLPLPLKTLAHTVERAGVWLLSFMPRRPLPPTAIRNLP